MPFSPSSQHRPVRIGIGYYLQLRIARAPLTLITLHDYGLYVRTLITNYLTWRAPRCRRGGVVEIACEIIGDPTHTNGAYANISPSSSVEKGWKLRACDIDSSLGIAIPFFIPPNSAVCQRRLRRISSRAATIRYMGSLLSFSLFLSCIIA